MGRADEDLRHGRPPVRPSYHVAAPFRIAAHVDLIERDALARQQSLRGVAVGTVAGGINLDHDAALKLTDCFIWERGSPPQPGRTPARRRRWRPPATTRVRRRERSRPRQARRRAPSLAAGPLRAPPAPGTGKPPCTFWARSDLSSPTCCGVALTRLRALCAAIRPLALAMTWASNADWLNRRAHWRRQCSGTGTSASASARSSQPARAIQAPWSAQGRADRRISSHGRAYERYRHNAPPRARDRTRAVGSSVISPCMAALR